MTKNKQNILCVDNDPGILKLLQIQLESNGYASDQSRSGRQAIKILETHHVDLIILDLHLPGMNGFTTLQQLKDMADAEDVPVIFLSAHSKKELKVKAFEYGADDYIVKPITGPILLAKIQAVLRRNTKPNENPDTIQGKVKELGVFDLLQMLTFSDKSYTVLFPEMHGKIRINSGNILSMKQALHTGKEALIRLSLLNQGTFSILDSISDNGADENEIPFDSLSNSIAVLIEEIKEKIRTTIPASLLGYNGNGGFREISKLKKFFPLSPQQLSGIMPGKIMNNIEQIANAFAHDVISAVEV